MIFLYNPRVITKDEAHYARSSKTTEWFQRTPESHTQLAEWLSNPTIFGCVIGDTKNPESLSKQVFTTSTARSSSDFTLTSKCISEKTNVLCLDIEVSSSLETWISPPLDSLDKVIDFVEHCGFQSYIIGRSSSAITKNMTHKWHVYCLFDSKINLTSASNMISYKVPDNSWYYGLTSAGSVQLKNSYCDASTFQLSRYFYEHPETTFHVVDKGLNKASVVNSYFKQKIIPEFLIQQAYPEGEKEKRETTIESSGRKRTVTTYAGFLSLEDTLLDTKGHPVLVRDVVEDNKSIRLASFIDSNGGGLAYYADTKTFIDFHDNGKKYTLSYSKSKTIEFTSKYLPLLDLSNRDTFILAPTGSGKTTYINEHFKDHVIFLVPTNAIVKDQNGMTAGLHGWTDLKTDSVNFMTYDKFKGHASHGEDLSQFNIVIDEVHTLFSHPSCPVRQYIFNNILTRKVQFKKLVLLTATFHTELLPIKNLVSFKYLSTTVKSHIEFVQNVYSMQSMIKGKTLIFFQSKKVLDEIFTMFSKDYNVLTLESGDEIPKDFSSYDIIATTSVLREGFSIKSHIDTVLLYNIHNAFGAYDIIQSIARPRVSNPTIKVISASTHFEDTVKKWPTVADLRIAAHDLSKGYSISDVEILHAISLEQFKKVTLMTDEASDSVIVNELGVLHYYLHIQKQCEVSDFELMSERLKEFLHCDVSLFIDLNDRNELPQFSLKEFEQKLRQCTSFKQLESMMTELNNMKEFQRQAKRLLKNIETTVEFIDTKDGIQFLNEEQQVQYKVNPAMYTKINQHHRNINAGVYESLNKSRSWKYSDTFELKGLKRILKHLDKNKIYTDEDVIDQLKKICVFEKLKDGHVVRRGEFDHIRVINKQLFNLSKSKEMKKIEVEGI